MVNLSDMSSTLVALMFAAGVAGWMYSKMGRRLGYGNTQNVTVIVLASFVVAFLFFFTLLRYVLNIG